MTGFDLAQCILHCDHRGRDLADCIRAMLGLAG